MFLGPVWASKTLLCMMYIGQRLHYKEEKTYYKQLFQRSMLIASLHDPKKLRKFITHWQSNINNGNAWKGICVIQSNNPTSTSFNLIANILALILCTVSDGYIPYIGTMSEDGRKWDDYFLQPSSYTIDEERIALPGSTRVTIPYPYLLYQNKQTLRFWHTVYGTFFQLNNQTTACVNDACNHIFKQGMRVLGVLARGTDYIVRHPVGHFIQPSTQEVLNKVKQYMAEWHCDYVYLATEDAEIYGCFSELFQDRLLTTQKTYYNRNDYTDKWMSESQFDTLNDKHHQGMDYITAIVILSKCNCFIGGKCDGTLAALNMNGDKYENVYLFDLGRYGIDNDDFATQLKH